MAEKQHADSRLACALHARAGCLGAEEPCAGGRHDERRRLLWQRHSRDDEEKDRAVALMRRVEAGVKVSMSYCINRTVSISSDPFDPKKYIMLLSRLQLMKKICRLVQF